MTSKTLAIYKNLIRNVAIRKDCEGLQLKFDSPRIMVCHHCLKGCKHSKFLGYNFFYYHFQIYLSVAIYLLAA